jgi:predicted DNA-binding antitoxin AbrB/MazE fold protein
MMMMIHTIEALFDGSVFHPQEPVDIEADTRVRIVVAPIPHEEAPISFLSTARSLNLEGPPDWSANLDQYLHEGEYNQ